MKKINEQENIIKFILPGIIPEIKILHGYNISNNFPVHFHNTFSVGMVEKGARILKIRGEKYSIDKGAIFIVPPYEPHSILKNNNEPHTYKVISYSGFNSAENYYKDLVISNQSLYQELEMFHENALHNYNKNDAVKRLNKISSELTKYSCSEMPNRHEIDQKIHTARQFIDENVDKNISLHDIASAACLSDFHFSRSFHSIIGQSPMAYLISQRIKYSEEILKSENSQIKAALESGFFDQSHFIKTFKRYIGVTPKKFFFKNIK